MIAITKHQKTAPKETLEAVILDGEYSLHFRKKGSNEYDHFSDPFDCVDSALVQVRKFIAEDIENKSKWEYVLIYNGAIAKDEDGNDCYWETGEV